MQGKALVHLEQRRVTPALPAAFPLPDCPQPGFHACMQPLEFILHDRVQAILDAFSSCFGVRILFCSPAGDVLTVGNARPDNCAYCTLIQQSICGRAPCERMDDSYRAAAAARRETVSYLCHAGLVEMVKAIHAGERLLGFVMLGQIRTGERLPDELCATARKAGVLPQLQACFAAQPVMEPDRVHGMTVLFDALVDYIVAEHLVWLGRDPVLEAVETYIRANIARPVPLTEVARHVHRSTSTVSHVVKKLTGHSFRKCVINMKLDRAEALMRLRPDETIAQIACQVGYDDPYHFSRLYRAHRRMSPTEFRQQVVARGPIDTTLPSCELPHTGVYRVPNDPRMLIKNDKR